jgi:hypothetical protein
LDRLEEEERQKLRIDARGLPLIGLGILMTGLPGLLTAWAWVGWLFVALATIGVVGLAVVPFVRYAIPRMRLKLARRGVWPSARLPRPCENIEG